MRQIASLLRGQPGTTDLELLIRSKDSIEASDAVLILGQARALMDYYSRREPSPNTPALHDPALVQPALDGLGQPQPIGQQTL